MKRLCMIEPKFADENVVVEFSKSFKIDKKSAVHVPNGFLAIVFINEKVLFKITPTIEQKLYDYGKEYVNKDCKIAFIKTKPLPSMAWGFGNIQVNNERLKEAYRVGANGKYAVEIIENSKLINSFENGDITVEKIRERTISVIKNIGSSVLGRYFAQTNISVFEVSSLINDLRQELVEALCNESAFTGIGIKIKDLTVDGIFIPEEDLNLIRTRINSAEESSIVQPNNMAIDTTDLYEKLSKELAEQIKKEIKDSELKSNEENKNNLLREMQKTQKFLLDELKTNVTNQMEEYGKVLATELDEKIQERIPLYEKATDDYIKNISITAENLIAGSKTDEDLIAAAGIIYSNVESNLRTKFQLRYENEKFVIPYKEYEAISDKAKIGGRYLLKRKNEDGTFSAIMPRVVKYNANGEPEVVEMMPIVRFIKAGLTYENTRKATEIWTILNKIRHDSDENKKILQEIFARTNVSKKDYLFKALEFYKNVGLYTKD